MKTTLQNVRSCRKDELAETLNLLDAIFHKNQTRRMNAYYPYAYGDGNLDNMRILKADGKVVSHAAIYPRLLITADGTILKTGCIGGVATHPDYRGKGYATIVLQDCIEKMERENYDISILWTNTPEFYRKLGWEFAGKGYCFNVNSGNAFLLPGDDTITAAKTTLDDYAPISDLYEKKPLRSQRTQADYPLLFNNHRPLFCQINGRLSAYVLLGDGNEVLEYGGDPDGVCGLFKALLKQKLYASLKVFTPPQGDEMCQRLEQRGFLKNSFYLGMIRVIHHHKFLQRFGKDALNKYSLNQWSKLYFGPEIMADTPPVIFYLWQSEHA